MIYIFTYTADSKTLEYGFGFRAIYAGFPSFFCFGIRRRSYSNFRLLLYLEGQEEKQVVSNPGATASKLGHN